MRVGERQVADLLRDLPAHLLLHQVGHESCDEPAVTLGLQVANFRRLFDRRDHQLLVALLRTGDHLAVVRSADLLGDLLAPGVGLVLGIGTGVDDGGVALGLEPSLANDLRLGLTSCCDKPSKNK